MNPKAELKDNEQRLWPQRRNGQACPVDGTLMVNQGSKSLCPKCDRTHEGHLVVDDKAPNGYRLVAP